MAQISKLVWRTADVPEELHELLATLEEEYPVSGYGRGLKLKAKVTIESDKLRVTSASKDTLQEVIAFLRDQDYGQPLQFTNYR